ncbi:unnamed protein product [Sphagnum jensenii]
MFVMAATVVRELGLMRLVSGFETYKTASGAVTQALRQIDEVPIKVGRVQCNITFMVVDTNNYDVLLGLDLLITISAIVDIEQGLIQVRRGPRTDVEVLPLTMILQLTLQKQADDFMKEEITDADDYADWIQWAVDAKQDKQTLSEATSATGESVLLQV